MAKQASPRDISIAELIQTYHLEIVEQDEIPATALIEDVVAGGTVLMETVGREITRPTNYFNFVFRDKQFTAPSTIISRLLPVIVDYQDESKLVVSGVHINSNQQPIEDIQDINTEMHHWGHQVYLVPYNDPERLDYNVLIHVSNYGTDGWTVSNYIAGMHIDKKYVFVKNFRNEPAT